MNVSLSDLYLGSSISSSSSSSRRPRRHHRLSGDDRDRPVRWVLGEKPVCERKALRTMRNKFRHSTDFVYHLKENKITEGLNVYKEEFCFDFVLSHNRKVSRQKRPTFGQMRQIAHFISCSASPAPRPPSASPSRPLCAATSPASRRAARPGTWTRGTGMGARR